MKRRIQASAPAEPSTRGVPPHSVWGQGKGPLFRPGGARPRPRLGLSLRGL